MSNKELYVDSIQFSYNNSQSLINGVYLRCCVGDIIALFGRNGSGKTTLFKIIFGSLKADNSFILINNKKTNKAYLTGEIGYLPQFSFLPKEEKVINLIKLLVNKKEFRVIILNNAHINTFKYKKVYQLSGGELRYLEICILIYQPTSFILLDEPFTGVDPVYIDNILDLINKFKGSKGFIISDHNYYDLLEIASKAYLLRDGSCYQVNKKEDLEYFYLPYSCVK